MRSKRALERELAAVADFPQPRIDLEQYLTPPEIAAQLCHTAGLYGDLSGKQIVDMGTGTGMLAIGASFGDPAQVVGIDCDRTSLEVAKRNERAVFGDRRIEWVEADVERLALCLDGATVLSNPPFGAQRQNQHADRRFLATIRTIADVSYTIHNEGSQSFVESFAADAGARITHAFKARFELPRQFDHHEADTHELETEIFRIVWTGRDADSTSE